MCVFVFLPNSWRVYCEELFSLACWLNMEMCSSTVVADVMYVVGTVHLLFSALTISHWLLQNGCHQVPS